jgi:methionine sulfoxide reductase heme-binding subunit
MASLRPVRRSTPDAWLKPGVLIGGSVPLLALVVRAARGTLGANPIADALNQFGLLALIFLVASLSPTPLKQLWGLTWPMRIRRLLGLLSFFYATLHLCTYVLLDRAGELRTLLEDVLKRPFITVGFLAWLMLVPLALTSTQRMIKRLGYAHWKLLHRLSYVAALFASVHFFMRVKKDISEPLLYGAAVGVLLAARALSWARSRRA